MTTRSSAPAASPATVTRSFRAAIRLGEDFITIEETVTLPLDAGDEEIAQAVALGLRIYDAQRAAVEAQVATIRQGRPAPAGGASYTPAPRPATERQIAYMATLQEKAGWSSADLAQQVAAWGGDPAALSSEIASRLIDLLRNAPPPPSALVDGQPPMLAALEAEQPANGGDSFIPF